MQVRGIPRQELRAVLDADWVDPSRRPYVEGDTAWVPVLPGEAFDREIIAEPIYRGRGYYLIGDIAVVQGKCPTSDEIQRIVQYQSPRGVIWREALDDITRTPRVQVVSGTCGDTRHKESGFVYILDPSRVMFSQGNRSEKERIARLVRSGSGNERVADMFAGIGYFSLPVAGAGSRVHAMEINPVACRYLERNIRENRLSDRITVSEGDCRGLLDGIYDRVLMGHFDALEMLPDALRHVQPKSTIHLHAIGQQEDAIRTTVEGAGFSCGIHVHKVKKYRPHAWHVVHDITIV